MNARVGLARELRVMATNTVDPELFSLLTRAADELFWANGVIDSERAIINWRNLEITMLRDECRQLSQDVEDLQAIIDNTDLEDH